MSEVKNILIAGGSGVIGKRLTNLFESKSFNVFYLIRNPKQSNERNFFWDPEKRIIDKLAFKDIDIIINLAGTPIGDKRWTIRRKRSIVNSRIASTSLIYESLANSTHHVQLVINASATGIYGNTRNLIMNESSALSDDFLGKTCQRWENAAMQFEKLNIRTVIFRIGMVLTESGGLLPELIKSFRFGFAPVIGNGNQYISWIHVDDLCKMISKAISDKKINGIYNAVAPQPLSYLNFTKLLVQLLGKKYYLVQIPGFMLKLYMGELANLIIQSTRVSSKKIESTGFVFKYPQADYAVRDLLNI